MQLMPYFSFFLNDIQHSHSTSHSCFFSFVLEIPTKSICSCYQPSTKSSPPGLKIWRLVIWPKIENNHLNLNYHENWNEFHQFYAHPTQLSKTNTSPKQCSPPNTSKACQYVSFLHCWDYIFTKALGRHTSLILKPSLISTINEKILAISVSYFFLCCASFLYV